MKTLLKKRLWVKLNDTSGDVDFTACNMIMYNVKYKCIDTTIIVPNDQTLFSYLSEHKHKSRVREGIANTVPLSLEEAKEMLIMLTECITSPVIFENGTAYVGIQYVYLQAIV